MNKYAARDIHSMEIEEVADLHDWGPFLYKPTNGELEAIAYLAGRYEVAEVLYDGFDADVRGYITFDPYMVGDALDREGFDRVPMLSDDTALQRLVWTVPHG